MTIASISTALRFLGVMGMAAGLTGQTKPGSDVLIFKDGEKLIGELKSATGPNVVFKSDIGFEVTVPWAKIQELHSDKKFAAIHKDVTLENREDAGKVPHGTLEMTDQKLALTPSPQLPPQTFPVNEVAHVVQEQSFERAIHHMGLLEGWKGQASFGLGLTKSTTDSENYMSSLELSRADPSESWLQVRNRTSFALNQAYSKTSQSGSPDFIIAIINADMVHDFYFKPRWFAFAGATFDHNSAQGLDLLQAYGGGLGVVVLKNERSELDARAGIGFMDQMYVDPTLSRKLVGSRFNETYTRTFAHGVTLNEQAGIRPAWNSMKNYFGGFLVALNVPVHRRVSVNVTSFDSYVNNPPPAFKKNTFQLSVGASFSFR